MTVIVESTKPMAVMKHTLFGEPMLRIKHEMMKMGFVGRLEIGITPGKTTVSRCKARDTMIQSQDQRWFQRSQSKLIKEPTTN